ncbi:hypothetical protein GH892_03285 [Bacillus thuringiensis]|uniref:hypothetical protein n=1 Tax=Bacillus toyonensis TaxID=155322 RepID=UPI001298C5DD|nr:hypothetical protein [Bacillus thuringiensis]
MKMKDYYITSIKKHKRGNMDTYKDVVKEVFGKQLSWAKVEACEDEKLLYKLKYRLQEEIKLRKSPISVDGLARAIQGANSGIGGSAFTAFQCNMCGEQDVWINTATPKICRACARNIATYVAANYEVIMNNV